MLLLLLLLLLLGPAVELQNSAVQFVEPHLGHPAALRGAKRLVEVDANDAQPPRPHGLCEAEHPVAVRPPKPAFAARRASFATQTLGIVCAPHPVRCVRGVGGRVCRAGGRGGSGVEEHWAMMTPFVPLLAQF